MAHPWGKGRSLRGVLGPCRGPRSRGTVGARRRLLNLRDTARAMSQENVEILRAVFEAWNAGDMEALFADYHPELVYHPRADEPDPSPHVGRDAYERLIRGFVESFSEVTFDVLELIDAG